MKELFSDFYSPNEDEFNIGWEKAVFILDTNVLLDLYRYPQAAREELIAIFGKISDRIWIPYQVALEFQRRRLTVIADQKETFDKVTNIITSGITEIEKTRAEINKKIQELKLKERHSSITADEFIENLNKQLKEIEIASQSFLKELEEKKKQQQSLTSIDIIREKIDSLLKGRIGSPPINQEAINKIYEECEYRRVKLLPPGLIDIEKKKDENSFLYSGIEYQPKYGDIVIWKQILEFCQKTKIESVIFITSEIKDDWWWSFKGETIGIKRELIEEIRRETDVTFFHAYRTDRFIEYAKKYLQVKFNEDSITQIRDISEAKLGNLQKYIGHNIAPNYLLIESVVFQWLISEYPDSTILNDQRFFDFIVHDSKQSKNIGVEIKYLRNISSVWETLNRIEYQFKRFYQTTHDHIDNLIIILVLSNKDKIDKVFYHLSKEVPPLPKSKIIMGLLSTKDDINNSFYFEPYLTIDNNDSSANEELSE